MSHGEDARGPWNEGNGPWPEGEEWEYIEDPVSQVQETEGQSEKVAVGHERDAKVVKREEKRLAHERSKEVKHAGSNGALQWSSFSGNGDGE